MIHEKDLSVFLVEGRAASLLTFWQLRFVVIGRRGRGQRFVVGSGSPFETVRLYHG